MESHESFKEELKGLLINAIKVCSFKINGQLVLNGKVNEVYELKLFDMDTDDGEHSSNCEIRIYFMSDNGGIEKRCKVRIDYIVKGKDVYVKYPILIVS